MNNKKEWWDPIQEAFYGITLKSLKIVCPKCDEIGTVTTKWIKGPSLKPIYILHMNRNRVLKICDLNDDETKCIRGRISVQEGDIKKILSSRKSYVLFSGGKDSLATLYYLRNISKNIKNDLTALYVDTTAGLPENIKYVKKVCKYLKVDLKIVRPKIDYFTLAKRWGIPSFGFRWCCRELKIKPIQEFLSNVKEPKVVFDGIRAAESNLRKQYIPIWYHPGFKCLSISAIFNWSDEKVVSFINSNGIPKTILHSLNSSTECWCGAYKTRSDFEKLYELDRDMF